MISIVKYLFEIDDENIIDKAKSMVNKFTDTAAENIAKGKAGEAIYDKLNPDDPWSFQNRRFKYLAYLAKKRLEK
jgi:hypothetical protein